MPFTVLSAEFAHETNTFSRVPTGYDKFMARSRCLAGDEAIAAKLEAEATARALVRSATGGR